MSTLTKAQLVAQLEASHVAYQKLEQRYTALCASVSAPKPRVRHAYEHRPTDAQIRAHDDYVAKLNAARELAMREQRSVRV